MSHLAALLSAMLVLMFIAGCASPPSRFYTLSAVTTIEGPPSDLSVAVGPVSVPATVDRPEIVVSTGPNQVQLEELERWASPLRDEIARTVAENLVSLLGTPRVTQTPQTLSGESAYRASIEVQRFDSTPGQSAALDALWTVRRPHDDQSRTGRTSVRESVREPGYQGLAAAHSLALARLSQDIADAIRSLHTPAG